MQTAAMVLALVFLSSFALAEPATVPADGCKSVAQIVGYDEGADKPVLEPVPGGYVTVGGAGHAEVKLSKDAPAVVMAGVEMAPEADKRSLEDYADVVREFFGVSISPDAITAVNEYLLFIKKPALKPDDIVGFTALTADRRGFKFIQSGLLGFAVCTDPVTRPHRDR